MSTLTIGKLANAAGVGIDTVRFYERAGLLNKPQRTASGYRLYAASDVARLRFIRRAKGLGFSLPEIAELLRLNDSGEEVPPRPLTPHISPGPNPRVASGAHWENERDSESRPDHEQTTYRGRDGRAVAESPGRKRDQAAAGKYQRQRRVGPELAQRREEAGHAQPRGSTNGSRQAQHPVAEREPPAEMDHGIPFAGPAASCAECKSVRCALTGFASRYRSPSHLTARARAAL
jgi:DNA-binding transcriptional MerR regulator